MKKLFAILLAVMMVASMATVASAANTTTLTTTVPTATYTLNIPADQEIEFGALVTDIGNVTVSNASGFAEGKNLEVTIDYTHFSSATNSTTIPYILRAENSSGSIVDEIDSGSSIIFEGSYDGTTRGAKMDNSQVYINTLSIYVAQTDWGKALAGEYKTTITYTAEVVAEQ